MLLHANSQSTTSEFEATLELARFGSADSLGRLLEPCRQYLLLIANQKLDLALTAKLGASDLVQDTFLAARRDIGQFRGATRAELLRWLRQILVHHLATVQRRYVEAEKRSARREVPLQNYLYRIANTPSTSAPSPSSHFLRDELVHIVQAALARLPKQYQLVIDLRHRQALPFDEVARQLNTSSPAARQLWSRAIQRLRTELRAAEVI